MQLQGMARDLMEEDSADLSDLDLEVNSPTKPKNMFMNMRNNDDINTFDRSFLRLHLKCQTWRVPGGE